MAGDAYKLCGNDGIDIEILQPIDYQSPGFVCLTTNHSSKIRNTMRLE